MPEGTESWRSFVDSNDIQPLGNPYGYQLELPFTEPYFQNQRRRDFFDDPRNLRGLIGDIQYTPEGVVRPLPEAEERALQVKRDIRGNPKLMQDLSAFTRDSRALGNLSSDASGLVDAYSLRQMFGEIPGVYGESSYLENTASSIDRGVVDPETGNRYRMTAAGADAGVPTSELSPRDRTVNTAFSLRPYVLAGDIEYLGSPAIRERFLRETGEGESYAPLKAQRVIENNFNTFTPDLNRSIDIDIPNDYDYESLRRLVFRNPLGLIEVGGPGGQSEYPGHFVERLEILQRNPSFDRDYVYSYLRENGVLPNQAFEEVEDFDKDNKRSNADYEGRSFNEVRKFAGEYPEVSRVLEGYAQGSRISKEDLNKYYSDYIPRSYEKLPYGVLEDINAGLKSISLDDPNLTNVRNSFRSSVRSEGIPTAVARLANNSLVDIQNQKVKEGAKDFIRSYIQEARENLIDVPTRTAGVGGGEYLNLGGTYDKALEKLSFFDQPYIPDDFEPVVSETFYSNEGKPYRVDINRDPNAYALDYKGMNESVLKMLEDKPYAGVYNIDFTVNGSYGDVNAPPEVKQDIMNFVTNNFRRGLPLGAVVRNNPASNESTRNRPESGNKRALWYQKMGFGADTVQGQYGYIDPDTGSTVPIQPFRAPLSEGKDTYKRSYYSVDPINAAVAGARELTAGIKRAPSALLPGAADLIPSPEAIRTGYQQGPAAMGRQMATEFVQSLPTAAASAAVLATPIAAPLAPGIGAGMVGVAGTRALNEVVRQQTGEGIVPKLRQTIGTAPRTGVANRAAPVATNLQRAIGTPAVQNGKTVYWAGPDYGWQSGSSFNKVRDLVIARETVAPTRRNLGSRPAVIPQIRPLNPAQRAEMQRRQKRNELQRRVDLANEQRNIWRGDLGLTELLTGR